MSTAPQNTAKVVSFAEVLARRNAAGKAPVDEAQPTTHQFGLGPYADPWRFSLDDVCVDADTNRVCFESKTIYGHLVSVFARWGLNLDDFTNSFEDMLAAYRAFNLDFFGHLRSLPLELASIRLTAESMISSKEREQVEAYGPHMAEYLDAVKSGDAKKVKKLMPKSGIQNHLRAARELEHAKAAAADAPRLHRGDARENPVLGPMLTTPIKSARNGETFAQFLAEFLELGIWHEQMLTSRLSVDNRDELSDAENAKSQRWYQLWRSPAYKQLLDWGLQPLTRCPRPDEAAVLFDTDRFVEALDGSQLRDTWRTALGPFVGFDQDFRLILEKDLTWWRLDHNDSEKWAGNPCGAALRAAAARPERFSASAKPVNAKPRVTLHPAKKGVRLRLHIAGKVVESTDAFQLGAAAALCGLSTVATDFEITPYELLVLKGRKQWGVGSDLMKALGTRASPEYLPLLQFHEGLFAATNLNKARSEGGFTAWFNKTYLPGILKIVPNELLKRTAF